MFVARFDTFLEKEFLSKESSGSTVTLEEIRDPLPENSDQTELEQIPGEKPEQVPQVPEMRRSRRIVRAPERYIGTHEILLVGDVEPLTYDEAMSREDFEEWLSAMKSECHEI